MVTEGRLIFTNGCFDLMHKGHVNLLEYCASLGRVVVGLNSDQSIRRLKGPDRPIANLESRKAVLESIRWVDSVEVFDEDTPIELIKKLSPDIVVKGGDYSEAEVVGYGLAEVRVVPIVQGFSTTRLVEKIRRSDG